MADEITICPLCRWEAKVYSGDADHVICEHCGTFKITRTVQATLGNDETKWLVPYLSAHTRQASERGEVITLPGSNWKDLARANKNNDQSMKLCNLLQLIGRNTMPGRSMTIKVDRDHPLLDAFDGLELAFLINSQTELGYIEHIHSEETYRLTAKGWDAIQAAGVN